MNYGCGVSRLVLIAMCVTYIQYYVGLRKFSAKVVCLILAIAGLGLLCAIYSYPTNFSTQVYEYIGKKIQVKENQTKTTHKPEHIQQNVSNVTHQISSTIKSINDADSERRIKYILLWGQPIEPFDTRTLGIGKSAFEKNACKYKNCFVTFNKTHFPNLTQFDAVAIYGKYIPGRDGLPTQRSERQKYIFAAYESPHYYRICDSVFDDYFNWTWTYTLDSDYRWGYFTIWDLEGKFVGPKIDMTWPQLDPINDELKAKLSNKTKMAAWFVSNCYTLSKREQFVGELQREAEKKYGWTVDVFGGCGKIHVSRDESLKALKRDYYFYFAFENSFAEDYVTEKLLTALNHNAVPVVFGAANYSR